jgi:UTP--glucose-1-phosphate uridylyltransferase
MKKVRKAVIPIAGLGSRFLPATKCVPKEILPIYDRPVIDYIVRELAAAGVEEVIFVVPPEGSITPEYFYANERLEYELRKKGKEKIAQNMHELSHMVKVATVVQQEPLGDGHAILQAEELVGKEDFFAFFGDEIFDADVTAPQQLLNARGDNDACVLGIQTVPDEDVHKFGIVDPGKNIVENTFDIQGFVEKPKLEEAPSNKALLGKNLCSYRIFDALRCSTSGSGGELRLVDAFIELQKSEQILGTTLQGKRFDVGNPKGLLTASTYFAEKKN